MSLHAYWDGERIDRAHITSSNVEAVRSAAESSKTLVHPFCGHRVYPRSGSRDGVTVYHFMHEHSSAENCAWAGESQEHLALKDTIVFEAQRQGWDAVAEAGRSGQTRPDHVPDVLAVNPTSAERVVFEVQLSAQPPDEYRRRQDLRVAVPGTRALWIARNQDVARRAGYVPIYHLTAEHTEVAKSPRGWPYVSLPDWVAAALNGELEQPQSRESWLDERARTESRRAADLAAEASRAARQGAVAEQESQRAETDRLLDEAQNDARRRLLLARGITPDIGGNFRMYLDQQTRMSRLQEADERYGDGELRQHGTREAGAAAHGPREAPTDLGADT
ncbi:hypothetical protein [Frigoribacterium sp. SL97]|uniref:hypothetical protein n=1 Tax=Frigoribacterium sp. SL97 TaxID=2994664 RepID=UPI00227074DE|nr:hypothetical protein [Frigoribacterium sp. SL97]WAC50441.1 hypothetical protein OVA02_11220 [Frigoribacterium sp. SL97]